MPKEYTKAPDITEIRDIDYPQILHAYILPGNTKKPVPKEYTKAPDVTEIRDIDYPQILHAYILPGNTKKVEIANAVPHKIEVIGFKLIPKTPKGSDSIKEFEDNLALTLPPLTKGRIPEFYSLKIQPFDNLEQCNFIIV